MLKNRENGENSIMKDKVFQKIEIICRDYQHPFIKSICVWEVEHGK